jgi:DNA-binding beta-propeller fold protein YncE
MSHTIKKYELRVVSLRIVICSLLCFSLLVPSILEADTGKKIEYVDSIREDEEGGKISFPSNVFFDPVMDEIYITDSKGRIIIYTSDLFPLFTLDIRKGIESPLSLAVDKEGTLYVLQNSTKSNPENRISVFNACLRWKRDILLEGFEGADTLIPNKISIDADGNLYLVGTGINGVVILDNDGIFKKILSPEEKDKRIVVSSVTIDENGRIYLVSTTEGRIYVYDKNGNFLFAFGEKGGSSGKLSRPVALGADTIRGRIYVVDYMRHTISVYDAQDGKYLFEFGGLGWGEGWFQHPTDIAIESNGRLIIADTFNNRIEVLQPVD